jgi:hypothetical protein
VGFRFSGTATLNSKATLTLLQVDLVGASGGPTISGAIGLDLNFGGQIQNGGGGTQISTTATVSYVRSTHTFSAGATISVQTASGWFANSGGLQFSYVRSPIQRTFSLALGTPSLAGLSNPQYTYSKVAQGSGWGPASHKIQAQFNPNWGSNVPPMLVTLTFANSCIAAQLSAAETLTLWGVSVDYATVGFTHCSGDFAFQIGGRINVNGQGVTSMTQSGAAANDNNAASGNNGPLQRAMQKLVPSGSLPPIDIMFSIGGAEPRLEIDIHLGATAGDLAGQMPFPVQNTGTNKKVAIKVPFPMANVGASVELHLPGLQFNTGPHTTWKAAMVYVRGIGRQTNPTPDFGIEWQFTTKFRDYEGAYSIHSPEADFVISMELAFSVVVPTFMLQGHMTSSLWIEDALGIKNFGMKGISLMITVTAAPPFVVAFGFGATACLYQGGAGQDLDNANPANDANIILELTIAGTVDTTDPFNNCFFFQALSFQMSEFIGFIIGSSSTPNLGILDLTINRLMFAISTKQQPERCQHQGPMLSFGVEYDLDMTFLGFDVMSTLRLTMSNSYLPKFRFFFGIYNNGALAELRASIQQKVDNAYNWFKSKCKTLWTPLDLICAAVAWLIHKLFDWLLIALFDIFVFYHFEIDVPSITTILTGGGWPKFALKFSLIGIMFDINIDIGNIINALKDILVQAFNNVVSFLGKIKDAISAWFSNIKNVISITTNSCRCWLNGCEERKSCKLPLCKRRRRWGGWGYCKSILCGCKQWKKKKNIFCGIDFSVRRRRSGVPTPPPPTPQPGVTMPTPAPPPSPLVGPCDTGSPCANHPHAVGSTCHNSGPSSYICMCPPGQEEIPGPPCGRAAYGIGIGRGQFKADPAPSTYAHARRLTPADIVGGPGGGGVGVGPGGGGPAGLSRRRRLAPVTSYPTAYPTNAPAPTSSHRRRISVLPVGHTLAQVYVPPTPAPTICGRPTCGVRSPTPPLGTYDTAAQTAEAAAKAEAAAANSARRRRADLAALTCHGDCTTGFWSEANPCAGPGTCVTPDGFCSTDIVECATGNDCSTCPLLFAVPTPAPPTPDPHYCPPSCRLGAPEITPLKPCMGCMTKRGSCEALTPSCLANLGYDCHACNPMTDAAWAAEIATEKTPAQKLQDFNDIHNAGTGNCTDGSEAVCVVGSATAHCGGNLTVLETNRCTLGITSGTAKYNVVAQPWALPSGVPQSDMDIASQDGSNYGTVMQADPNLKNEINAIEAIRTVNITHNTLAEELAAVKAYDDDAITIEEPAPSNQLASLALGEANQELLDEFGHPLPTPPPVTTTPAPTPMCNIPNRCANAPHACGSVCVNSGATFVCNCPPGYSMHSALPCAPTPMTYRRLIGAVPPGSSPGPPTPTPAPCPCGRQRCLLTTPSPTPPPTPYPNWCANGGQVCTNQPHAVGSTCTITNGGASFSCTCPTGTTLTSPVPCTHGSWSGTAPAPGPSGSGSMPAPAPIGGHSLLTRRLEEQTRSMGAAVIGGPAPGPSPGGGGWSWGTRRRAPTTTTTTTTTSAPTNAPNCGWSTCQPMV